MEHQTLQSLRETVAGTIEDYLKHSPTAHLKFVSDGEEFFFLKAVHVIMPTRYSASTLLEFAQALECVSIRSLYFHIFNARLRLGRPTNDFAIWLAERLGLAELAESVSRLDPYAHTLDALRSLLLSLVRQELNRHEQPHAPLG